MANPTVLLGQNGSMAWPCSSQWASCPWAGGPSTKNRGGRAQGRQRRRPFPVVTGGEVGGGLQMELHGSGVTHFGAAGRTGLSKEASRW
jgi:hypothetical protein